MCLGNVGPSRREGPDDAVFFSLSDKTEASREIGRVLSSLGGIRVKGGFSVNVDRDLPVAKEMQNVDRGPVFLDETNVHLVHEPEAHENTVPIKIDSERILKAEKDFPAPEPKWDGEWHGTPESRMIYLRQHKNLWGFTAPENCKRKTSVFCVRKKDGMLRKILACCNLNGACNAPPASRLPGPWNIQKIRFKSNRFFVAESDVSAYYSRLEAPEWLKYFLCLSEVRLGDVV